MLMTRQEAAAAAIIRQMRVEKYSCLNFRVLYDYEAKLANEYKAFSNASPSSGFIHLRNSGKWYEMSNEERQSYRLEMLYYFWLSNQDM